MPRWWCQVPRWWERGGSTSVLSRTFVKSKSNKVLQLWRSFLCSSGKTRQTRKLCWFVGDGREVHREVFNFDVVCWDAYFVGSSEAGRHGDSGGRSARWNLHLSALAYFGHLCTCILWTSVHLHTLDISALAYFGHLCTCILWTHTTCIFWTS